jgi:hypothetical protein
LVNVGFDCHRGGVSNHTFVLALTGGAAVLALWVDRRFPALVPDGLRPLFAHAVVALVLLELIPDSHGSVAFAFVVVFAAALPVFVYCFLVGVWLVRLWQELAGALR